MKVARLQILIMLGFAVIKYKVQEVTFQPAILDLYRNFKKRNKDLHKRYYSTDIQLSYLEILEGFQLF